MKHDSARPIALNTLCRLEETKEPVDLILDNECHGMTVDQRDRQLAMAIVYGICRKRKYLDWILEKFSSQPLHRLQNRLLQAMRVGLFQILFLDRVPDSAAVNETVAAFKTVRQPQYLIGFINGILRNICRKKQTIIADSDPTIPADIALNHPDWLVKKWQHQFGRETAASICRHNNEQAKLCLRINKRAVSVDDFINRLGAADIKARRGLFAPGAVYLAEYRGNIQAIPGFDEGFFQIQDEAAQLVTLLLGPFDQKKKYLDGCAGLGGKTSHLDQLLPEGCRISAVEPNTRRLELLRQSHSKRKIDTHHCDLENIPDKGPFDAILIDAPCSGTGVIGRHPDIRWNRQQNDLPAYRQRQLDLLDSAAELLGDGGLLVYATCSLETEENDSVVESFLASHQQFTLTDCHALLPKEASDLIDDQGFLRTVPGRHDLGGFFAARMKKHETAQQQ